MRALINDSTRDVIPEYTWLDWFGPNGSGLIARMPGYRLVEIADAADPEEPEPPAAAEPEPAPVPDEKQQRIAALEAELSALKETS